MPSARDVDLSQIDAVTFTSSSTARNFVAMVNGKVPAHLAIFCIGPVTAETARELGLRVNAIADEQTVDGLIKAMVDYYQEGSKPQTDREE